MNQQLRFLRLTWIALFALPVTAQDPRSPTPTATPPKPATPFEFIRQGAKSNKPLRLSLDALEIGPLDGNESLAEELVDTPKEHLDVIVRLTRYSEDLSQVFSIKHVVFDSATVVTVSECKKNDDGIIIERRVKQLAPWFSTQVRRTFEDLKSLIASGDYRVDSGHSFRSTGVLFEVFTGEGYRVLNLRFDVENEFKSPWLTKILEFATFSPYTDR